MLLTFLDFYTKFITFSFKNNNHENHYTTRSVCPLFKFCILLITEMRDIVFKLTIIAYLSHLFTVLMRSADGIHFRRRRNASSKRATIPSKFDSLLNVAKLKLENTSSQAHDPRSGHDVICDKTKQQQQ